MGYLRKLKRNLTIHNFVKCECGGTARFFKEISFKNKKDITKEPIPVGKNIVTYRNVFWCKKCGRMYKWKTRKGEN